jgi:hypothetical protein
LAHFGRGTKRTSARAPACRDERREPRLVASVEGVQSKLQRVVRLALEYVRGGAAEGRRLALLVLTLGAPVGGAVDDLVIAPRVDQLQFVACYAVFV